MYFKKKKPKVLLYLIFPMRPSQRKPYHIPDKNGSNTAPLYRILPSLRIIRRYKINKENKMASTSKESLLNTQNKGI